MPRAIPEDRFQDLLDAATAVFLEQGSRRTQVADVAARMGL
jgi:AcrR family transcriptional regulator